jgi:hypothetical protein
VLTDQEWRLLVALRLRYYEAGNQAVRFDSLEIAKLLGLSGKPEIKKQQIKRLLHGYYKLTFATVRKEFLDRETKEPIFVPVREPILDPSTGRPVLVAVPGLIERGWVIGHGDGRDGHRRLEPGRAWWYLESPLSPATATSVGGRFKIEPPPDTCKGEVHFQTSPERPYTSGSAPDICEGEVHQCTPSSASSVGSTAHVEPPPVQGSKDVGSTLNRASYIENLDVEIERLTFNVQRCASQTGETKREPEAPPPTDAELREVIGRFADFPRAAQAEELVRKLGLRGIRLVPRVEESTEKLFAERQSHIEMTAADDHVIRWLKPDVLASLHAQREHAEKQAETKGANGNSAAIAESVARGLRARITNLLACPTADDSDCRSLALDLARTFHESDTKRSAATYSGLACDVKAGRLPIHVLLGALEESCRAKVANRGAAFVAAVKRLKSAHLSDQKKKAAPRL